LFVLEDPLQKIAGYTDVKRVAPAGHDVGAIDLLVHAENLPRIISDGNKRAQGWLSSLTSHQTTVPQQICHPERSLALSLRQTQSKDLRLLLLLSFFVTTQYGLR